MPSGPPPTKLERGMRKRTIAVRASAALGAVAIGAGVVAAPAAAEPTAQPCHARIVSTVVQPPFGPGMRAIATRAFADYPKAVQDTQRAVRAFCGSHGPPPPGSGTPWTGSFDSSSTLFRRFYVVPAGPAGPEIACIDEFSITAADGALPNYDGNATLNPVGRGAGEQSVLTLLDLPPPNAYDVLVTYFATICEQRGQ